MAGKNNVLLDKENVTEKPNIIWGKTSRSCTSRFFTTKRCISIVWVIKKKKVQQREWKYIHRGHFNRRVQEQG